ncbi:gliding motility-associated C-terminal domain-containing protein [Flavobacterium sp.]|uniref:gliding motility-associated C-terminal domain-containing protein n=1 Tax=Flavobacterium sp. TaxID=239 RepID=UPI00261C7C65|nr:gliding motility-associated C-terminal domain-containing protein [Flavobacterium sp.]
MKKIYILVFLLLSSITFSQNFDSFASGIKISNTVYNTTGNGVNQINPNPSATLFDGVNLGSFGQNSTCARITGGEIKTWKTSSGNVCSANLYWRVYPSSASPTGSFNTIPLSTISDCDTSNSTFFDGLGPCSNGDQKWKNYSTNVDFISSLLPGNYILEIYYDFTGSDVSSSTCETTKYISNFGNNFKANFTISNPSCAPTVSPTTVCEGNTISLTANPTNGVAPYTFSWTGPNGFTSNNENPTLVATLASGGVYTLTVTDSCGATSTTQNTQAVTITPKIDPEFEGLNPGLCRFGTPPFLPNLSSNGISGTWNPATVDNSVAGVFNYTFTPDAGQCANIFVQTIFVVNNVVPSFTLPTTICQGSTPPNLNGTSNNGIVGTWSPSTISNSTSGTYTFTPNAGQCATVRTININVIPNVTPTFTLPSSICQNAIAPLLPTTSNNGINGTWNPSIISNTNSGTYTFTPNTGQCATNTTVTITVNPNITPTFNPIAPICENATAPILSTTSNNGITGTWNPSTVSNTTSGTYTFTPDAGQCALQTTHDVIVNPNITPTFDPLPNVCYQTTAPTLPTTSNNGITGTWNPSIVSNTASGTYTFTPTAGLCALPVSITITVDIINPTFDPITPICENATAPILPTTSNNGITGTWNPTTVSNTASATYTFTPNAGQCATTTTLNVSITPNVTPTFNPIAPICENGLAPTLPSTSNNGITGTWNPSTVSNTSSGTYTFAPDAGQCALQTTIDVIINPNITPAFSPIAPICENGLAPILPLTSNNGITGTWNPSTVSNTSSGTYTFTPDAGQCATSTTLNITINPNITPSFNPIPPICENGSAPTLPLTSNNGITGTWNPSTVSNTVSGTYTFTPNAGQCAVTTSLNVVVNTNITPTFDIIPPVCYGSTAPILPLISNNGITGTWNPSTVNNTSSGTYTFTPDSGQCATSTSISVTINTITPTFDTIAPICYGSTAPTLSTTSNNGIIGTWNPSIVSNTASGTYTFTPNAGQCAVEVSVTINVNSITPTFSSFADVCYGSTTPVLPSTSNNGIIGTWNPSTVSNTASGTYTFTPNAGQCAIEISITINVNSITPTFDALAPICENGTAPTLPLTSNNGIIGTWNPSTVSNAASGTYTFTPNTGQCAVTTSLNIVVTPNITPTFDAIADVCYGSTAPSLPLTSNNGITGTWNPSTVSNTTSGTYIFTPNASQCATTTSITINVNTITPTFNAIADVCYGSTAPILPTTSNNGITGTWNPSTVSNTTSGTYTFTPNIGQCAVEVSITINVNSITPTFDALAPICENGTAPTLPLTSNNGIIGTWNPSTVSNTASATYTFTPNAGQCAVTTLLNIVVTPNITPTFDTIADVCYGSTAPSLPLTSNNGITGTWNPSTVSNTISGTYIFTPNASQCATTTSITINVNSITPTFDTIAPICENGTAPTLPLTSNNGIGGTWNPSTVSNTTSGTYTFTPNAGQCAVTTSLNVVVTPNITPIFDTIADVCYGSIAPSLPLTSNNGITGTWNPSTVNNTTSGTYIFTPDAGQCATTASITINVNTITPTFNTIADVCYGSTAPILPTTSNNGIIGTWNPSTVSNTNSGTYTFTPDAGQCATTTSISINVNSVSPTFNPIANICYGSTAPILPTTSNNGITGTWNSLVSNTTSGTYTFTPDAGQCATITSISINVNSVTPNFFAIAPICENATAPILPTSSIEGITGTWNSTVSNTISGTYTFTPDAGQCATTTTINVIVNPNIIPTFTSIAPICSGSTTPILPTTSNNGIIGTWNSTVSNTSSGTYTFIPNAGQCATTATLSVIVNPNITPTFTAIAPICSGSTAPTLPTTSNNGIIGTWNSTVSNTSNGTYTFTPNAGQCATTTTLNVVVNSSPTDLDISVSDVFNQTSQGTIVINGVTNGVSPYAYSLNGGSFSNSTTYSNLAPGNYTITVQDSNGCEYEESVTIISNCMFPNGISPNGDTKNDTFNLSGCNVKKLELFNRYGMKINSYENYTDEWFGRSSNGDDLPEGTYFYIAEITDGTTKTGWVYVAR